MNTTNIDLYTGQVSFPIPLASLSGRNGLDVNIGIQYNSQVQTQAITWNMDAPTGVAGLGWNLPFNMIAAEIDLTGNRSDDCFFLVAGNNSSQLMCTGIDSDGSYIYETKNYSFWKIRYQPASEIWTIIHENGDTYIYGDSNSGRDTVQWAVKWSNWVGSSNQVSGQQIIAIGWNLNQITNRFGDIIIYQYQNVNVATGNTSGLYHTQASYLSGITGVDGSSMKFNYLQKDANEYQDPHINPAPPNAYQERFETMYLHNIEVYASDLTLLSTTNLIYTNTNGTTAFLGTGNLTKRLLTGVNTLYAGAPESLPGTLFTYYGQDVGDNVSDTNIYNSTTQALYGAIKQITYDMGGSTLYKYSSVTPDLSDRQQVLTPPVLTGVTFSNPLFYFADNYTIATWYGSDNTAAIMAYTWVGRWLIQDLGAVPVSSLTDYQAMRLSTSALFFALYTQNQVHLYHADHARAGEWIQPSVTVSATTQNYFSTTFGAEESVLLVTANNIAAVLGTTSGKLYRYNWHGTTWTDQAPDTPTGSDTGLTWGLAAENNYIVAMYTSASSSDTLHMSQWYLDQTGAWQGTKAFSFTCSQTNNASLQIWSGKTFVAFSLTDTTNGNNTTNYGVVWWDELFTTVKKADLGSYSYGTVTPSAIIVKNSFVSFGQQFFRFDGKQWNYQDVTGVDTSGSGTLIGLSCSIDQAVRVLQLNDGNYLNDVIVYNPNTGGANAWSVPSGMSATAATQNVNVAPVVQNAQSNYVIFDNKVYYCNSDSTWSACALTLPALSGNDSLSVTLFASGYLVFQQNGNTYVYTLLNGNVQYPAAPITLTGQQIYAGGGAMAGQYAFVSYTGTFGDAQSQLSLNRVTGDNNTGKQIAYVTANTLVSNGYTLNDIYTAYEYDPTYAVATYAGRNATFSHVSTIPGQQPGSTSKNAGWTEQYYYNGLTTTEATGLTFPTGSATNATQYYTFATGLLYSVKTFPANAAAQGWDSVNTFYWTIYLQTLGNTGIGAYARTLRTEYTLDAVTSITEASYSTDTGLVTTTTNYNYNSQGQQEQVVTCYTYFWEEYDTGRALNLLTPVILTETENITGNVTTQISQVAIPYKDDWGYGTGQWNPFKAYQAQSDKAPTFTSWHPDSTPPTSGWLKVNEILSRSSHGNILRASNVLGVIDSNIYDLNDMLVIAAFRNADTDAEEASYYGFMPYENPQEWVWSTPDSSIAANITETDYYTGVQSLILPPSPSVMCGPCCRFQPTSQSNAYVFSTWVKSALAFDPAGGTAQCTIRVYNASGDVLLETFTLPIPNTQGQWIYLQQVVDLPAIRTDHNLPDTTILYLWINAYNSNGVNYCLIDDMRFSPTGGSFNASVYDTDTHLVTATLDNNGQSSRNIYDVYQRVIATTAPNNIIAGLEAFSYSSQQNSGTFQPAFPNSKLKLATTSNSMYYDFHDVYTNVQGTGPAWVYSGDDTNKWNITDGVMRFSGSSTSALGSRATLTVYAFTNFAVRISIPSHSANVGITNGELVAYWDATAGSNTGAWILARYVQSGSNITLTTITTSQIPVFGSSCVFSIIDNLLLFFVDGTQVFSYYISSPNTSLPQYGFPSLVVNNVATFDDMVVMNDPQMFVSFLDGLGNETQSLSLEGLVAYGTSISYPSVGNGVFCDSLGRPQYYRMSALPALAIDQPDATSVEDGTTSYTYLINGNQDTYLVNENGQQQTLQEYLSGSSGYTYSTLSYEASPLSRLIATILPRESNQAAQNFTITQSYGTATSSVVGSSILPASSLGNYFMQCTTNQNGVATYLVTDQAGKTIAQLRQTDNSTYNTTAMIYDAAGRLITKKLPNYFQPPANSQDSDWEEQMTYTFTGLLSSSSSPDSGLTSFIYDDASRLRFALTANGTVATQNGTVCQQVIYYKYDNLDRIVETGYVQDPSYQWGTNGNAFQNKANESQWPVIGDGTAGTVAGEWNKKYVYDFDPANLTAQYLLGRPWQISVNNAAGANTENINYDQRGNKTIVTTTIPGFDSNARITEYTYNNQNQVTGIYYPYLSGARDSAFKVGYYYNRLGQLASVGNIISGTEVLDPDHPATAGEDRYAAYYYNPDGTIARQVLNNITESAGSDTVNYAFTRNQTYNIPGWLTGIDDPYFSEEISYYEKPGYNGSRYYNGNIAQTKATYKQTIYDVFPDSQYTYGYDKLNRITAAMSSLNGAYSLYWGNAAGTPANGYDANGNITNQQRGVMYSQYNYTQPDGTNTVINDHMLNTSGTASDTLNITTQPPEGTTSIDDWSWGSNNNGPSQSTVVDKNTGTGKCLQLCGGSLGHYEYLKFNTYLAATGNYSLTFSYATLPGFNGPGTAGWYLSVQSASGLYVETLLWKITDTAGSWKTDTIPSIDMAAILSTMGIGEELVYITLELRNGMRLATGDGAGAGLQVNNVILSSVQPALSGNYSYAPSGNVIQSVPLQLYSMNYEPVTGLISSMNKGSTTGTKLSYAYGSNNGRVLDMLDDGAGNVIKQLYIQSLDNNPLFEMQTGATDTTTLFIYGADGLIACKEDADFRFVLKDHLSSARVFTDGHNNVIALKDYLPYGGISRSQGSNETYLYTGQQYDWESRLYNYKARMYDAGIGRFYECDPMPGNYSPYSYVNNNPISFTDPTGMIPAHWRIALLGGMFIASFFNSNSTGDFFQNTAIDLGVNVVSSHTVMRLIRVVEANIPVGHPAGLFLIGASSLAAEGIAKGWLRRTVKAWWYNTTEDTSLNLYDGVSNIASYALFQDWDLRNAISPRAQAGQQITILYLKFPNNLAQWNTYNFWRGFVIPYKGIATNTGTPVDVGIHRHAHHHWNAYGFGPWFVLAVSRDRDAVRFAERAAIRYLLPAARLTNGQYQQNWDPWTVLAAGWFPNFLNEFVYMPTVYGIFQLDFIQFSSGSNATSINSTQLIESGG